ncbi:MAG: hypothetical protein WCE35_17345, partial [Bradyrhizobium sp.]
MRVESRIRRISPALARFEKEDKNGANRRRAPNFAALVWFSGQSGNSRATGYCDTDKTAAKEAPNGLPGGGAGADLRYLQVSSGTADRCASG